MSKHQELSQRKRMLQRMQSAAHLCPQQNPRQKQYLMSPRQLLPRHHRRFSGQDARLRRTGREREEEREAGNGRTRSGTLGTTM